MVLGRPDRVGYLVWPRQTESQCRAAVGLGNALRCERMLLSGRKAVNNVFAPGDGHLQVRSTGSFYLRSPCTTEVRHGNWGDGLDGFWIHDPLRRVRAITGGRGCDPG